MSKTTEYCGYRLICYASDGTIYLVNEYPSMDKAVAVVNELKCDGRVFSYQIFGLYIKEETKKSRFLKKG